MESLLKDAMQSKEMLQLSGLADNAVNLMMEQAKRMMETMIGFKELMMMYTCAMKEVQTKFEILSTECKLRNRRNPISSISTRLKRSTGIAEKMMRNGIPFSLANVEKHINDVAGVRVICPYIDDIYTIADAFLAQDDIVLIARKDYIENPKPNGYRSLHLIVTVPVFFAEGKKDVKVEVQIRTIAMDFWASLEHQMKYKQEIPDQELVSAELRACAETIRETDEIMLSIRRKIEAAEDVQTEEEQLFERFSRLDIHI
ncbi:MAG: GTP pyrophosphokinase family protein [Ruminococcaceae bacterium]|nr:GTP pyrophosphokinase family protein [Oscillospiraceae bacterium]